MSLLLISKKGKEVEQRTQESAEPRSLISVIEGKSSNGRLLRCRFLQNSQLSSRHVEATVRQAELCLKCDRHLTRLLR